MPTHLCFGVLQVARFRRRRVMDVLLPFTFHHLPEDLYEKHHVDRHDEAKRYEKPANERPAA